MIDQTIDNNCIIPEIILITFANPLCSAESFKRRIPHRIAPMTKILLTTWSKKAVEAIETVVGIGYELKGKNGGR
jgi:hypothetical protein